MSLDKLPVVRVVEKWFWREYWLGDKFLERHSPFRVWRDESRLVWNRHVTSRLFRLGMWLVRHGAHRCPHCEKTSTLREGIQ